MPLKRPPAKNWPFIAIVTWGVVWAVSSMRPVFGQADDGRVLIRAKHIYSADGVWGEPGVILINDGKISFVGDSIELGLPAKEIEVDSVMPGIVNVSSSAGLSGGDAEVSREITPEFQTLSAIDFESRAFKEALDQGVTTVQVLPGTESVFAGLSCTLKTAGDPTSRVLASADQLVIAMSSDPTSRNRSRSRPDSIYVRQPTNRMGVVWIVRATLHKIAQGKALDQLDPNTGKLLEELLAGQRQVISVSRAEFDIRAALDLGKDFGFQPVIYGGDEVYRILDEFKERQGRVVYTALTATTGALRGREGTELRWNIPGKLSQAEVDFCLAGDELLDQARFATRFGLAPQQALAAITLQPAKFIGQADRIGSITVGKDADLLGLSGAPLRPTSGVEWTMVNGKTYSFSGQP
ncbi:MAG: amidohydrolase family protein [Pirellulaceae bacterium]